MDNGLKKSRIETIDALRGFAMAAIFLIHTSNHFLLNKFPSEQSDFLMKLDEIIRNFLYFVFEGKAFSIFALFFGFTCALQIDRKRKIGVDYRWRMIWRMIILSVIGVVNAAFFAGGDPLVFYAISMVFIIPFSNINSKWMIILVTSLLIQPLDIAHNFHPLWEDTYIAEYEKMSVMLNSGNMFESMHAGITHGLKGCLMWALQTGRFSQTLGLFFVGILCFRHNLFTTNTKWTKYYPIFAILTLILYFIQENWLVFTKMYYNLLFTLTLIALFVKTHQKHPKNLIFDSLSTYGRMSLSNFVGQSVLGALIYYPWALNLAQKLGVTQSIVLTFILICIQIYISKLWLKKHKKGPLENVWSKLTNI